MLATLLAPLGLCTPPATTPAPPLGSTPIILGSASASRASLLRAAQYEFEVTSPDIDERAIRRDDARELVLALGFAKAAAVLDGAKGDEYARRQALLITCDQVVTNGGRILEKPRSSDEARAFIASYAREPATTVGSCVVTDCASRRQWSAVDEARVFFRSIPDATVAELIADGGVFACAGGLMVEHPLVQPHVERIEGTMDSIMGLCTATVHRLLGEALAAREEDSR